MGKPGLGLRLQCIPHTRELSVVIVNTVGDVGVDMDLQLSFTNADGVTEKTMSITEGKYHLDDLICSLNIYSNMSICGPDICINI